MLRWLHISDIHYNFENYSTKKMRDKLIDKINKEVSLNGKFDFIIITGDLVYQGGAYGEDLKRFISDLINGSKIDKKNIFYVPGNHDLKRTKMRTRLVGSIVSSDDPLKEIENIDEDTMEVLQNGQSKFWEFFREEKGIVYNKEDIHFIEKRDKFNIINLNTCLFCNGDNDEEHLTIFLNKLYDVLHNKLEKDKFNIAIGHHNIDCFLYEERERIINNLVDENVSLYLCGHSHRPKFSVDNSNEREFYISMAGAGVVDDYAKATYSIGVLDESYNCKITYNSWDNDDELWSLETKGLGRRAKNGVFNFTINNVKEEISSEIATDIYIEEDDFKDFIIDFHNNVENAKQKQSIFVKEDIKKKFKNMKCNSTIQIQFSKLSRYFYIIDEIMSDSAWLGIDKRLVIPNVIYEEYNNVFDKFDNGNEITEAIVNNVYYKYKNKIKYTEIKLKIYIKTLVFWLINECDIFDDEKE